MVYDNCMKFEIAKKLKKAFKSEDNLKATYGKELSKNILKRISVLEFADSLAMVPDVPPTRRHKLTGKFKGCWAIDISKNYRLIIKPMVDTDDLNEIKEIEIIDILDYH